MERMRRVAFQTVQRACLFGALAIFCLMVGLSYELRLAFKAGGTMTIKWNDCTSATLTYDIPSAGQGEIPLERIVNDNVALCEAL